MVSFETHLGDADGLEVLLRDGAGWIRRFDSGNGKSHHVILDQLGVRKRVVAPAGHSDEPASRG